MTKILKNPTAQEKRDLLLALLASDHTPVPGVQGPGFQTPQPEAITVEDMLLGGVATSGWSHWGPDPFEPRYLLPESLFEAAERPEWVQRLRDLYPDQPGLAGRLTAALKRAENMPLAEKFVEEEAPITLRTSDEDR